MSAAYMVVGQLFVALAEVAAGCWLYVWFRSIDDKEES